MLRRDYLEQLSLTKFNIRMTIIVAEIRHCCKTRIWNMRIVMKRECIIIIIIIKDRSGGGTDAL